MRMTSLNLGSVAPTRRVAPDSCPQCGAGKDKRIDVGGFGQELFACGECGHEFKETSR